MKLTERIKGWFNMLFLSQAKEIFNVRPISSAEMDNLVNGCADIYAGRPYWLNPDEHIKTINFAKSLCSETARLATLGVKIKLDDGARGKWLQEQIDSVYFKLRDWVEYGCAYGAIILKPNGKTIDIVTPDKFTITNVEGTKITGIVFQEQVRARDGKHYYTRLEYHSNVDGKYTVTNKTFYSDSRGTLGDAIDINKTPWKGLQEETTIQNAEGNLFAMFRTPQANNVDIDSVLGMPIFSECIEELKDLDIAYSRNALEIEQSKRTILIDSDRLTLNMRGNMKNANWDHTIKQSGLPDMVKAVDGGQNDHMYQEINPTIQTPIRMEGINALLSQIGYKCGFSNGYFVFNEQMGIQTATGVEASQQRTIQFVKDVRDKLECCIDELLYALNAFADGYGLAPLGQYEVTYDFGDITYNVEEDRGRWWNYVIQQKVPAWMYFVKFEGMTEDEAKEMIAEAQPQEPEGVFSNEE